MGDPRPGEAVALTPAQRETKESLVDSDDSVGLVFRFGTLFVAVFNVLMMVPSLSGNLPREGYPA